MKMADLKKKLCFNVLHTQEIIHPGASRDNISKPNILYFIFFQFWDGLIPNVHIWWKTHLALKHKGPQS